MQFAHSLLSIKIDLYVSANSNCSRIHFKEEMYATSSSLRRRRQTDSYRYLHAKESSNSKRSFLLLRAQIHLKKKTTRFHIIIFSQQKKKIKDLLFRVVLYLFFLCLCSMYLKFMNREWYAHGRVCVQALYRITKRRSPPHTHTHMIRTQCVQLYSNLLTKCPVFVCVS